MKKQMFFITFFLIILLSGCQSKDHQSILAQQSNNIKEVKLADFIGLDDFNEDFEKKYTKEEDLNIFKNGFQQAQTKKYDIKEYDYNIEITLSDETERELHLTKTDNKEIVLKYMGDNTDTFVVDSKNAEKIIELIY